MLRDLIDAFTDAVGGILALDASVIAQLQIGPAGLAVAIWILVLATISDVIGNSPVLFMKRIRPGRLAAALGIETILSLVRLAIWIASFWIVLLVVQRDGVSALSDVVLIIGIGYAPMLWGFLVVIPTFGPLVGRVLVAWTLVTMTASIAVASGTSPDEALAAPLAAMLVLVAVRRSSDRVSIALLGSLSRRVAGVDLMQRTRAMDPLLVVKSRRPAPEAPGVR